MRNTLRALSRLIYHSYQVAKKFDDECLINIVGGKNNIRALKLWTWNSNCFIPLHPRLFSPTWIVGKGFEAF